jgi:hypothetical protein
MILILTISFNFSSHFPLSYKYVKRDYLGKAIRIELKNGICSGNQHLTSAVTTLSLMYSDYEYIVNEIACSSIHKVWTSTFEDGLCEDTIFGVFSMWVSQTTTLIALFMLSIASSIMMLYFDNYWDISATAEEKFIHERPDGTLLNGESSGGYGAKTNTRNGRYTSVASTDDDAIRAPKEALPIPVSTNVPFQGGRGSGGGGSASKQQR